MFFSSSFIFVILFDVLSLINFSSACYSSSTYFPKSGPAQAVAIIKGIYEQYNISGIAKFRQEVIFNFFLFDQYYKKVL